MSSLTAANKDEQNVVSIKNLNFRYDTGAPLNINGLDCIIPANSKVILVGANGAGKSTLLRILTGVIYLGLESDEFDIAGTATPHDQAMGVAYLGGVWKRRRTGFEGIEPYSMDIAARDMMKKWQDENLERRDELVRVLGINLDWRMHVARCVESIATRRWRGTHWFISAQECSDGQRKKVRIMLKLLRPFKLCVIDEFAADLDIFSRARFFEYLSKECALRGAAVVYATHIFDQADKWATHVAFMQLDKKLSPVHSCALLPCQRRVCAATVTRIGPPSPRLRSLPRNPLSNRRKSRLLPVRAPRLITYVHAIDAGPRRRMYVLVLEELERQYRAHSHLFDADNQCLTDVIMAEQACEKAADRHFSESGKGYESGRVARAMAVESMDEHRRKRREEEKARELLAKA